MVGRLIKQLSHFARKCSSLPSNLHLSDFTVVPLVGIFYLIVAPTKHTHTFIHCNCPDWCLIVALLSCFLWKLPSSIISTSRKIPHVLRDAFALVCWQFWCLNIGLMPILADDESLKGFLFDRLCISLMPILMPLHWFDAVFGWWWKFDGLPVWQGMTCTQSSCFPTCKFLLLSKTLLYQHGIVLQNNQIK